MAKAKRKPAARPRGYPPVFEAFAIRASDSQAAARAAEKLRGKWRVLELAPALGEFQLVSGEASRWSAGAAWEASRELARQEGVQEAEPQFAYAGLEPDDAFLPEILAPHEMPSRGRRAGGGGGNPLPCAGNAQWSVNAVKANAVWPTSTGNGIVVGHPDTGYSPHPEIWDPVANRVLVNLGYDFLGNKADPRDPLTGKNGGHGTATASVIMSGRGGPNNPFVEGTAPAAQIVPLRVSDSVVHFSFANATRAVLHAVDKASVHVISMSLGGPFPSRAFERALLHARDQGVVSMAAAGNVWPWVVYPARYAEVLAVAATNCQSRKWSSSASGSAVDCSAPGESVWRARARPGAGAGAAINDVDPSSGTSYAVATTAGICALWLEKHGRANLWNRYGAGISRAFHQIVVESGCDTPPGWDTRNMGAGIINAQKVVAAPLPAAVTAVRSRAPRGLLESAVDYFPTLDPDQALTAISAGVRRGGRQSVRAAFDIAGDELLFQLGTNPQFRAQIQARAAGGRQRAAAPAPLDASRAFRRAFGL